MGALGSKIFRFKKMKKIRDIIFIVILILLLFLIRAFENDLFYDPLIVYFQNDYLYTSIPEIKLLRLFVDILKGSPIKHLLILSMNSGLLTPVNYYRKSIKASQIFVFNADLIASLISVGFSKR